MSRYRFIAEARTDYPVRQLCAVLQVSASGFYDWLNRAPLFEYIELWHNCGGIGTGLFQPR